MDLYGSPLRITWSPGASPVVIVDFLDDLDSMIEVVGQKLTQQVQLVRAAGVKVLDRGNRSNSIRISKRIENATLQEALVTSLSSVVSVPVGSADVLIEVQGQSQKYRLKNATVGNWEGGIRSELETFSIVSRTISGGELILEP